MSGPGFKDVRCVFSKLFGGMGSNLNFRWYWCHSEEGTKNIKEEGQTEFGYDFEDVFDDVGFLEN